MIIIIPLFFILVAIFNLGNGFIALGMIMTILTLIQKFSKVVKKHAVVIYLLSMVIGFVAYLFKTIGIVNVIYSGVVGFSVFIIVMFAPDIKMGRLKKLALKTTSLRAELSIIGFILITPHALDHLFFDLDALGLIAYVIMVPLFVTSFRLIRTEIDPKDWKRLHKISYVAYFFIYAHIIFISEPLNAYVYIGLASIYFYNKFLNLKGGIFDEIN